MDSRVSGGLDDVVGAALVDGPDGVAVVDDGTVVEADATYAAFHGYDDPGEIAGKEWEALYESPDPAEALATARETGSWQGRLAGTRADGGDLVVAVTLTATDDGVVCVAREETERAQHHDHLEWLETVLSNVPDPVYALDLNGRITWINDYDLDRYDLGYDREELIGEDVSAVLDEADIDRALDVVTDLLHSDRNDGRCEVTLQGADGETLPAELHMALLPGEDGPQGTIGIIREITDRKHHEQQLSVLQRVLRHNVRNASTVITGYADALDAIVPERHRHQVERIRRAANDLNDVSEKARRIQRKLADHDPAFQPIDVARVLRERRDRYADRYPGAEFTYDLPERAVASTGEAFVSAVDAIVENAVVHNDPPPETPEERRAALENERTDDGARVHVAVEERDDRVAIVVADDGPGIPEHELSVLTSDTETALDHGSGLGLWLVRWFVGDYDGELSFGESEWDGARVEVALPTPG